MVKGDNENSLRKFLFNKIENIPRNKLCENFRNSNKSNKSWINSKNIKWVDFDYIIYTHLV